MDQFAPATTPTTFGELMEIRDSVSGESQCHKELHKLKLAIWDYHPGNHSLTYAHRLWRLTQYPISYQLTNRSLLNPQAFTPAYNLPSKLPYRNWIQMNILYWLVCHLYTNCTICHYWLHISAKSNWWTYFATCRHCFNFSDQIVRHDNSSVHVQGSHVPHESSRLQTELIDDWSTWYRHASYT